MKKNLKDSIFLFFYYLLSFFKTKKDMPEQYVPNSILIISWHLIGDSFLTLPVIASVKKMFPGASVTVLSKPFTKSLYEVMDEVDTVAVIPDNALVSKNTYQLLRKKHDLLIDLTINRVSAYFSLFSNSRYKISGSGVNRLVTKLYSGFPLIFDAILPYHRDTYAIDYLSQIVRNVFPAFQIDTSWRFNPRIVENNGEQTNPNRIAIGFAIGASRNENLWEASRWSALANILSREENVTIYLFGGKGDEKYIDAAALHFSNRIISFVGSLPLLESCQKISEMDYFVSNDTGLMHIAIHYTIPTVCLIGPSSPANYIPANNVKTRIVRKDVFCHPCYLYLNMAAASMYPDCTSKLSLCKNLITVPDILSALEDLRSSEKNV